MDREEPLVAVARSTATSSASTRDERPDEELFLATLEGGYEDDAPWSAVTELRRRNTETVFRLAVGFCESTVPLRRARGLDVLGQLGADLPDEDRLHFDDTVDLAIARLSDGDGTVVNSAAWALSHLRSDRAMTALIQIRNNTDPDVRWAVACGMAGSKRSDAIETLKQLMVDANEDVRNWATFGLGSQCTVDSPGIRFALKQRLDEFGQLIWPTLATVFGPPN